MMSISRHHFALDPNKKAAQNMTGLNLVSSHEWHRNHPHRHQTIINTLWKLWSRSVIGRWGEISHFYSMSPDLCSRFGCVVLVWLHFYSLSGRTSHHRISWSLEAARSNVIMITSLWNLTVISAALLPRCLLNFRAIGKVKTQSHGLETSRDLTIRRPSA